MFLKRCQRGKHSKTHVYWVPVGSDRTARGSWHRLLAYLGDLADHGIVLFVES